MELIYLIHNHLLNQLLFSARQFVSFIFNEEVKNGIVFDDRMEKIKGMNSKILLEKIKLLFYHF